MNKLILLISILLPLFSHAHQITPVHIEADSIEIDVTMTKQNFIYDKQIYKENRSLVTDSIKFHGARMSQVYGGLRSIDEESGVIINFALLQTGDVLLIKKKKIDDIHKADKIGNYIVSEEGPVILNQALEKAIKFQYDSILLYGLTSKGHDCSSELSIDGDLECKYIQRAKFECDSGALDYKINCSIP